MGGLHRCELDDYFTVRLPHAFYDGPDHRLKPEDVVVAYSRYEPSAHVASQGLGLEGWNEVCTRPAPDRTGPATHAPHGTPTIADAPGTSARLAMHWGGGNEKATAARGPCGVESGREAAAVVLLVVFGALRLGADEVESPSPTRRGRP